MCAGRRTESEPLVPVPTKRKETSKRKYQLTEDGGFLRKGYRYQTLKEIMFDTLVIVSPESTSLPSVGLFCSFGVIGDEPSSQPPDLQCSGLHNSRSVHRCVREDIYEVVSNATKALDCKNLWY
jgi:hypothetical protein